MFHTPHVMHRTSAMALFVFMAIGASAQAAQTQQQQQPPQQREQSQQGQGQDGGEHQHRRPPPEAFEACKGKTSGQTCSFTPPQGQHGQMDGTCFAPENKPLACRPTHRPDHDGDQGDEPGGNRQQNGASRPSSKR